jgi:hypothetical protein
MQWLMLVLTAVSVSLRAAPVFDATTGYTHMPGTEPPGMERLVLANHEAFWPEGADGSQAWPKVIDDAAGKRLAAHARAWRQQGLAWICFDIEHLDPKRDPAGCNAFVSRCAAIVREAAPGLKLGFYGLFPVRDYYRARKGPDSADFKAWQAEDDALRPAAAAVDAVFPSLYTFYDDADGWAAYAQSNIAEARRYGKPAYPFLWPRFHDSNRQLAWTFLGQPLWKKELALTAASADGLVVWDYGQHAAWDPAAPWWAAAQAQAAQ